LNESCTTCLPRVSGPSVTYLFQPNTIALLIEIKTGYKTTGWDEKDVTIANSSLRITRVQTPRKFEGKEMEGEGVAEYVMVYHPAPPGTEMHKMTASYTGLMHFTGTINGSEKGAVVLLANNGVFAEGVATAEWVIDEKTASGGLKGLKGKGGYSGTGAPAVLIEGWLDIEKA
jgi:hypothetical protein